MEHLHDAALTADELVRASGVDPGEGAAALMALELAGQVMLEDGVLPRGSLGSRVHADDLVLAR